jgi:hypothetical protein
MQPSIDRKERAWNLGSGILGAIGVRILLISGIVSWLDGREASRLDDQYDAVIESVESGQDAETISISTRFLDDLGEEPDPRRAQVEDLRVEAVVREVLRLTHIGDVDAARELLAQYGPQATGDQP